jgi:hypothetical protein
MIIQSFPWHAQAFLGANLLLCLSNYLSGPPWWAVWPLMVSAIFLALHYLFYKAVTVDDRWAEERVEELNLKSYDRSHIEDLKARYDTNGLAGKT